MPFLPDECAHQGYGEGDVLAAKGRRRVETQGGRRRRGKVIAKLRDDLSASSSSSEESSTSSTSVSIQPSSTGWSLATVALRDSLGVHLVHMANGEIMAGMALSEPRRFDVTVAYGDARLRAERGRDSDPYHEIVTACFQTLGSRRSNHSSIIGGFVIPTSTPEALRMAGKFREEANRTLAQRAVDLATASRLLDDPSRRAVDITSLLRLVLFSSSPGHPFSINIIAHDQQHASAATNTGPLHRMIAHDAYLSVLFGRPLQISDAELERLGIGDAEIQAAAAALKESPVVVNSDPSRQASARLAGSLLMRTLARLFLQGPLEDLSSAKTVFLSLWEQADAHAAIVDDDTERHQSHYLSVFSAILETSLAELAARQCRGPSAKYSQGLLASSQRRFLTALKRFLKILAALTTFPNDNHARAFLLNSLDLHPGWLRVALTGAVQHAQHQGSLASPQFSWKHLQPLHGLLILSAPVFSSMGRRQVELEEALKVLGLDISVEPARSKPLNVRDADEEVAAVLVTNVLEEIG